MNDELLDYLILVLPEVRSLCLTFAVLRSPCYPKCLAQHVVLARLVAAEHVATSPSVVGAQRLGGGVLGKLSRAELMNDPIRCGRLPEERAPSSAPARGRLTSPPGGRVANKCTIVP